MTLSVSHHPSHVTGCSLGPGKVTDGLGVCRIELESPRGGGPGLIKTIDINVGRGRKGGNVPAQRTEKAARVRRREPVNMPSVDTSNKDDPGLATAAYVDQ